MAGVHKQLIVGGQVEIRAQAELVIGLRISFASVGHPAVFYIGPSSSEFKVANMIAMQSSSGSLLGTAFLSLIFAP
jgi:hypothetical protein